MWFLKKRFLVIYLAALIFAVSSCQQLEYLQNSTTELNEANEYKIKEIKLTGAASLAEAELSGMTWFKEDLIILPQYPFDYGENTRGKIYKINKKRILDFIEGKNINPIEPVEIIIHGEGLTKFNKNGSGYEAITFIGNDVYLAIEFEENNEMNGYVVKGKINDEADEITLDSSTLTKINTQANINNLSDEAIFTFENQIFTIYEANGKNVNSKPVINKFDKNLKKLESVNFQNVEFRITDATIPRYDGKFWVINYMYSGDWEDLNPAEDEEIYKFRIGKSRKKFKGVERLLEFQISDSLIYRTETPPIQLELSQDGVGRNWEGISELKNYGFLIITDYYPKTILGFVEYKKK